MYVYKIEIYFLTNVFSNYLTTLAQVLEYERVASIIALIANLCSCFFFTRDS